MSERLIEQLASITSFPSNNDQLVEEIAFPVSTSLLAHVLTFLQGQFVSKLHRQQLELDASREQVQLASQRITSLRSQLRDTESSSLEATSKLSAFESRCLALEGAYGKERAQAKQATLELQSTLESFASFRRHQAEQSSALRAQLENSQFEAQTARAEADRLETQTRTLTRQLTSLQDSHAQLKAELKIREGRFIAEMDAKERLVQAYAQAAQNASERASAAEDEIEGVRGAVEDSEVGFDEGQEEWRRQLQESNQRCRQMQSEVDRLQGALNSLLSQDSTDTSEVVTDARVVALEVQLERTKEALQESINALEASAPRLQILSDDNARLHGEIVALTETVIAGAAAKEEITQLRRQLNGAISEGRALVQENADLARQVQGLLAELEGRKLRVNPGNADGMMDSAALITERLVDFNSIATLQARNQELLKALRSTCTKMEALEAASAASETVPRVQLEEALQELEGVREARLKQAALVERFLKGKFDETLMEDLGREPVTKVKIVQVIKEVPAMPSAAPVVVSTEFEVKCAHLEAQLEVAQERSKFTLEAWEALKVDHSSLQQRFTAQQGTLQFIQAQGERAAAELATLQDRDTHLQGQVSALKQKAADLQDTLTHLQAAHDSAVSERDRLSALIPPLQSMLTDHEASETALKRHFDTQLAFMERELQATRKQLSDSTASHSQIMTQIERERSDLLRRLETVMQEAHAYKQSTIQLEVQAGSLASQVQELESVLRTAASREMDQDQQASKVNELKVRALAGQVKELKEANGKGEACLAELQVILEGKQAELEQAASEINELRQQLSHATAEVQALQTELTAKETEIVELRAVASQVARLESEVVRLAESNASLQQDSQSTLQEMQARLDELAALKTSYSNTQATLQEIDSQLNSKTCALNAAGKETESLRSELLSLRQENSALMDELTMKSSAMEGEQTDALQPTTPNDSRLLHLLRTDKDKLIEERDQLSSTCAHLQVQLEQLQATLNAERTAVSTQAADYARLLQQIEEFQAKSAEGIKARLQVEQLRKQLAQAEQNAGDLAVGSEAFERAQAELRVLNEIVGERDAELTRLRAEMEALKQNAANLKKTLMESKLSSAREIESLKRELTALKEEMEAKEQQTLMNGAREMDVIHTFMDSLQQQASASNECIVLDTASEPEPEVEEEIEMSSEAEHLESESDCEEQHEPEAEAAEVAEAEDEEDYEEEEEIAQVGAVLESEMHDSHESKLGNDVHETIPIPTVPTSNLSTPQTQNQLQTQPSRKVVSLVGISSSTSAAQSTAAPVPMITTASGKKITPITAPEPITRKSASNASINTSNVPIAANAPSSPASDTSAKAQRNKKKKKLKNPSNAGVGKNVRRNN